MKSSSVYNILPFTAVGLEDPPQLSFLFHPQDLQALHNATKSFEEGDIVLRKSKGTICTIKVVHHEVPPYFQLFDPTTNGHVGSEAPGMIKLRPKSVKNQWFSITSNSNHVVAKMRVGCNNYRLSPEILDTQWLPGTILASDKLLKILRVEKTTVSVEPIALPVAKVCVVCDKMSSDNLDVTAAWDDMNEVLTELSNSIREYEVVRPRQVLKAVTVEELHSDKSIILDGQYAILNSDTKFLFQHGGKGVYIDVHGNQVNKAQFTRKKTEYELVNVMVESGTSLFGVVESEITSVRDIGKHPLSQQVLITKSTHPEILVGDVLMSINGVRNSNLQEFQQEDFYMNPDPFFATFNRPISNFNPQPKQQPGAGSEQSPAVADKKEEDAVVQGDAVKLAAPQDPMAAPIEPFTTFVEEDAWDDDVPVISEDNWDNQADTDDDWPEEEVQPGEPELPDGASPEVAPDRPSLDSILAEKAFRTLEVANDGSCFWESVAVLRHPHSTIATLRARGKVVGLRMATYYRIKKRFEDGELDSFGITMEQIERIADHNEWSGHLEIAELSRNLRQQIRIWVIQDMRLETLYTTEEVQAPEGESQQQAPETVLNILHCNGKDPTSEMDRNHFMPLMDTNDLAEGLGFSIVWADIQEEGAGAMSDSSWDNVSVCSDVQSVCSLNDLDENILNDKDVKVGIVVYKSKGTQVGIMCERASGKFNFPHRDFVDVDSMEFCERMFEEMAWVEDPRCFAILPRIMIVQEKKQLILLFPAMCNCELRLMNDVDHEWKWMDVELMRQGANNLLPTTMRAIAIQGSQLLSKFSHELPPLEDRNAREAAEIIMSVLTEQAERLNKKGKISRQEMLEYLYKHPEEMQFMLENLYNPMLNCKQLFIRMQRWLINKLEVVHDGRQEPKEYRIDGSESFLADLNETEEERQDRLFALSLQASFDADYAEQLSKEEQRRNNRNNYSPPKRNYSPQRQPGPRIHNRPVPNNRPPRQPAKKVVLTVSRTFQTRGHPSETLEKGWKLNVVNEIMEDGVHLVLVDHERIKYKQWLGTRDFAWLEGVGNLRFSKKAVGFVHKELPDPMPAKKEEPKSQPAKVDPQPNAPVKETDLGDKGKLQEKRMDPIILSDFIDKSFTISTKETGPKAPVKQEESEVKSNFILPLWGSFKILNPTNTDADYNSYCDTFEFPPNLVMLKKWKQYEKEYGFVKLIADCIPPTDSHDPEMPDPAFLNALRDSLAKIEIEAVKSMPDATSLEEIDPMKQFELEKVDPLHDGVRDNVKSDNAQPSDASKNLEKRDPVKSIPQKSKTEQIEVNNLEEEVEAKEDDAITSNKNGKREESCSDDESWEKV